MAAPVVAGLVTELRSGYTCGTLGASSVNNHNDERICVVYFENRDGHVVVAPDRSHPTPHGYIRKAATSLREIDKLSARLNRQDSETFGRMWQQDRQIMIDSHDRHRTSLRQRLLAPDCGPWERLFIQRAFAYFDKKESEYQHYKVSGYFIQREFDSPATDPNEAHGKQIAMPKMSDRLTTTLTAPCVAKPTR